MKKQLPAIVASFALVLPGPLPSTFANPISIDHQVPKNQVIKLVKLHKLSGVQIWNSIQNSVFPPTWTTNVGLEKKKFGSISSRNPNKSKRI